MEISKVSFPPVTEFQTAIQKQKQNDIGIEKHYIACIGSLRWSKNKT